MKTLALVIPDLFKPLQFGNQVEKSRMPQAAALCELLTRSQRSRAPTCNYIELLFHLFQVSMRSDDRLPIASLTCLADHKAGENGCDAPWLMRVDPVHLQPDRDHLILLDNYSIQLAANDAEKIVLMLNQHFADDPFSIFTGAPGRWYLALNEDPGIHTHPLADVVGHNIDPFLMTGDQRRFWQSFMTEVQMLLHTFNLNTASTSGPQLPVNSVWLWGEGSLSSLEVGNDQPTLQCVFADDALSRGLARFSQTRLEAVPESAEQWLQRTDIYETDNHETQMIVMDNLVAPVRYGDLFEWQSRVTKFNDDWVLPLLSAVKSGDLKTLLVYEGNGRCYRITNKLAKRWWKRTAPLQRCI